MIKNNNVIVACDLSTRTELKTFLKKLLPFKPFIKIGLQAYCSFGNELVKDLKKQGYKIFLDLKLYDIPNTVYETIKVLDKLKIDFLTIHALGGIEMMKAARKATSKIKLLAVTILTSMDEKKLKDELLIKKSVNETVETLAINAWNSKIDGVICSANEAKKIKNITTNKFLVVTPGIRLENQSNDDQARVATPNFARKNESDFIVVGRAITKSKNPKQDYETILKQFNGEK